MKPLNLTTKSWGVFFITASLLLCRVAFAADAAVHVNVDNFVRAETASQIDRFLKTFVAGKVNTWAHLRTPTPIDNQAVIRMNRDTLYSAVLVDISKGATLTIPDTGDRYLYSVNNISGEPNKDGSFTVHFGGDPKSVNYLPIMEGWNYIVRLYQPRKEVLDGSWTFPDVSKD